MKILTNPYLAALLVSLTAQAAVADRLVDPTRPSNVKAAAPTRVDAFRLEAILNSNGTPIAIVSGKLVRAGDTVGDARIDEVRADGIRYTKNGRSHTARLEPKVMQVRRNVVLSEEET
jgi:MSHA biogenesis protein MshK